MTPNQTSVHDGCVCGHERYAHCDACIACGCDGFEGQAPDGFVCPECAAAATVRDERDGYQRRCEACGYRGPFERFCPMPGASDEERHDG